MIKWIKKLLKKEPPISKRTEKQLLFDQLLALKNLIKEIDKELGNRHAQKQFWRDFIDRGEIRQGLIDKLLNRITEEATKEIT